MTQGNIAQGNMWDYGHDQSDWNDERLVGYKVEATDGSVGKVHEATPEVGSQSIVVKTGLPVIGEKVMLPAGLISSVDHDDEKIFVNATKDQIKASPEFSDDMRDDATYRDSLSGYYAGNQRQP